MDNHSSVLPHAQHSITGDSDEEADVYAFKSRMTGLQDEPRQQQSALRKASVRDLLEEDDGEQTNTPGTGDTNSSEELEGMIKSPTLFITMPLKREIPMPMQN